MVGMASKKVSWEGGSEVEVWTFYSACNLHRCKTSTLLGSLDFSVLCMEVSQATPPSVEPNLCVIHLPPPASTNQTRTLLAA